MFRRESFARHEILDQREIIIEQESVSENYSSEKGREAEEEIEDPQKHLQVRNEMFSFCQPAKQSW